MNTIRFQDRREAGRLLAQKLIAYRGKDGVVFALPRGGVVLGYEVARLLQMPLDLLIPRKVGYPGNPEYGICAVTEDGHLVCNEEVAGTVDPQWLKEAIEKEQGEARRRRELYVGTRKPVAVLHRTAIIVDDGIATGLTMRAALLEVRDRHPARLVVAIPVVPPDIASELRTVVDELVALDIPSGYLGSVGAYYVSFPPTEDTEVLELLRLSTT